MAPEDRLGGHAYLISSVTGNVVEATLDNAGYGKTTQPFDAHIAGFPTLTDDGTIYNGLIRTVNDSLAAERLRMLIKAPHKLVDLDSMRQRSYDGLEYKGRQFHIMEHSVISEDGTIIQTESGGALITDYESGRTSVIHNWAKEYELTQKAHETNLSISAAVVARETETINSIIVRVRAEAEQEKKAENAAKTVDCSWATAQCATHCTAEETGKLPAPITGLQKNDQECRR